jgi:hypothetical protein
VNSDTLVAVQAYEGELRQVKEMLPGWEHHECPLVFISPEDARIDIPGYDCRWAGERGWGGLHTIDRQIEHLKILAEYPQEWILYNDADSFCILPEIPGYLYEEDDVFWSNQRPTGIFFDSAQQLAHMSVDLTNISAEHVGNMEQIQDAKNAAAYLLNIPAWESYRFKQTMAFQPPYFFSRTALLRMIDAAEESKKDIIVPLIDWWWPLVAKHAGLLIASFPNGHSHTTDKINDLRGHDMVHSITERNILIQLLEESQ